MPLVLEVVGLFGLVTIRIQGLPSYGSQQNERLGSGVPYLNTFLLYLFLKGTIIKYKSILFSLVTSKSRRVSMLRRPSVLLRVG